jgi:hypothetical protein
MTRRDLELYLEHFSGRKNIWNLKHCRRVEHLEHHIEALQSHIVERKALEINVA